MLQRYYEFTHDEIKALEECDKESFYQRCLPFSTLFATATYAAMKYGESHLSYARTLSDVARWCS